MMSTQQKKLDAFQLKIIAIIAMLINHIGSGFPAISSNHPVLYFFTEVIGRLTMPIMTFFLVEGVHYTKSKPKYVLRITIFWLLSIVPFCLWFNLPYTFVYNMMYTLLISLLFLICCEKISSLPLQLLLLVVACIITFQADWSSTAVLMTYGYYRIKNPTLRIVIPAIYGSITSFLISYVLFNQSLLNSITLFGILLVIPLLLAYNGERGWASPIAKWSFYIFYPAHLLILYVIRLLINLL